MFTPILVVTLVVLSDAIHSDELDVTLLIQKRDDVTYTYCVAGTTAIDSGLYVSGTLTKNVTQRGNYTNPINIEHHENMVETNSTQIAFKPIADRRWQSFTSIYTDGDNFTFNVTNPIVSVRSDGLVYIYANEYRRFVVDNKNKTIVEEKYYSSEWNFFKQYETREWLTTNGDWLDIVISKDQDIFSVMGNRFEQNTAFSHVQFGSQKLAEWKIHEFKYWNIPRETNNFGLTFQIEVTDDTTCVAAYVLLHKHCNCTMDIFDDDDNILKRVVEIGDDGETWKKLQLDLPKSVRPGNYELEISMKADFPDAQTNFWRISNIHYCRVHDFAALMQISRSNENHGCATLKGDRIQYVDDLPLTPYTCLNGAIGRDCRIDCQTLSRYFGSSVCDNSIICVNVNGSTRCYCPTWSTCPGNVLATEKIKDNVPSITKNSTNTSRSFISMLSSDIIPIIIGVTFIGILLMAALAYKCYRSKKPSSFRESQMLPLLKDVPKDKKEAYEEFVRKSLQSKQTTINGNRYVPSFKAYEQPLCLDVEINSLTYIYKTNDDNDLTALFNLIRSKDIAVVIHVKIDYSDESLIPTNIGKRKLDDYQLDLKAIKKTANFTKRYFVVKTRDGQTKDVTFYEVDWYQNQYPLNMILFQLYLFRELKEARSHLICCCNITKSLLTILCHACLQEKDVSERVYLNHLGKLRNLLSDDTVYNNMCKMLLVMMLDCIQMKDTSMEIRDKFDYYTKLKLNTCLIDEMKYLNHLNWYDKMMMELSGHSRSVQTSDRHDFCVGDRKYIMAAVPTATNLKNYFKEIAIGNVDILIGFNYHLKDMKSPDLQITLTKEKQTDSYEVYSCVFQFNSKFVNVQNHKRTIKLINLKSRDHNKPAKFLTFCDTIDKYISNTTKVFHITCKDGIKLCGTYVAFALMKQQMDFDKSCNVCSVARQLRCLDGRFFATENEYKYLYDLAVEYVVHTNVYEYVV